MLVTHKIAWDKCLSHQLWPAIEKGWKDKDKEIFIVKVFMLYRQTGGIY